jgi:hypothetical protein
MRLRRTYRIAKGRHGTTTRNTKPEVTGHHALVIFCVRRVGEEMEANRNQGNQG